MTYYRLYFLGREGRIESFAEIEAESDVAAIPAAEAYQGTHALELWCGGRRVHAIEAQPVSVDTQRAA